MLGRRWFTQRREECKGRQGAAAGGDGAPSFRLPREGGGPASSLHQGGAVTRTWIVHRDPCRRCDDAPRLRPCPNRGQREMTRAPAFPSLGAIERVAFFKRDEITTDLICCEVEAAGRTWFFHEEAAEWDALLRHLEALPGFRSDWYAAVVQPPFETGETVAYEQAGDGR